MSVARYHEVWYRIIFVSIYSRPKSANCNGVTVNVHGEQYTFHCALLVFLADTLAAHLVGGFKQSMLFALRVCCTCMATTGELPELLSQSDCILRTTETHFEQCMFLSGTLTKHFSASFGINRMSALEELPGYSV